MIGVRHEKYSGNVEKLPFFLGKDIKRTPYNCSKEQNWHENIEIQLCTEGEGTVLLDGEKYTVNKDDIIVVNSDVVHYTFTQRYLQYTCIIISTEWCRQIDINYDELLFSPFVKNPLLVDLINNLADVHSDYDDTLRIAKLNVLLLRILIALAENYSSPRFIQLPKNKKFDVIKQAVTFIHKNFNKKITLSQISKEVFLDKYALCKEFKKYTGQTVIEYLHQYRVIKAIDYLSEGHTVSETAFLCGFENLSFFTKIFKRHTGKKPSFYKK